MFARKNSATLLIIWILLLALGSFWYFTDANNLVGAIKEEQRLSTVLKQSQTEVSRLTKVENIHGEVTTKWQQSPKRIISADEPSFTLSYLNWIMSSYNLNIYYDFVLNSKRKSGDVTKFAYTLAGEGTYNDINRLIWHLTYEPILYQIESISLRPSGKDSEFIRFNMKLQGFTVDSQSDINENFSEYQLTDASAYVAQHDVFKPLVKERIIKNIEVRAKPKKPTLPKKKPGEIDVRKASIKAVTANSVFISEGGSGVKELRIGDAVYLGRLVAIYQQSGKAEFIITKFGISEKITLSIDPRK